MLVAKEVKDGAGGNALLCYANMKKLRDADNRGICLKLGRKGSAGGTVGGDSSIAIVKNLTAGGLSALSRNKSIIFTLKGGGSSTRFVNSPISINNISSSKYVKILGLVEGGNGGNAGAGSGYAVGIPFGFQAGAKGGNVSGFKPFNDATSYFGNLSSTYDSLLLKNEPKVFLTRKRGEGLAANAGGGNAYTSGGGGGGASATTTPNATAYSGAKNGLGTGGTGGSAATGGLGTTYAGSPGGVLILRT